MCQPNDPLLLAPLGHVLLLDVPFMLRTVQASFIDDDIVIQIGSRPYPIGNDGIHVAS